MVEQKILEEFVSELKPETKDSNKTYSAIVSKIDKEGTVWVRVAGSDKDTPTALVGTEVNKGDAVNVEWRNNKLYIANNFSNPAAGVGRVQAVEIAAEVANTAANNAVADAVRAKEAADDAKATADSVHDIAVEAKQDAEDAEAAAGEARQSAENASEYAARALGNLSTVQSVTETLNWITAHGTMTLTTDTALDPTHVYFVRDNDGDYEVGSYHYSVVTEPKLEDVSTYYVLSIDESLNNYVGTHLAVTSEGLWLLPDAGGNKVLIATGGQGHTYADAGTYIIDENDNISAQFLENGTTIYGPNYILITHLGYGLGKNSSGGMDYSPYYSIGERTGSVGNYSVAAGSEVVASGFAAFAEGSQSKATGNVSHAEGGSTASGFYSHAEGDLTLASGNQSHAEGQESTASGKRSHAEGQETTASGDCSHAEGDGTEASGDYSHAEGDGAEASGNGSHAENAATASGNYSHAEGYGTASGAMSHAQNDETIAQRKAQTAIGAFNIADTTGADGTEKGDYILIVGNGTSNNARSNALTVDWLGEVQLYLDVDSSASKTTAATSGEDKDLFNAIRDLGWYDDVIV